MTTFNYLKESERTASGNFYGNYVEAASLIHYLENFAKAANKLDRYKKLMFYGEDKSKGRVRDNFAHNRDAGALVDGLQTDGQTSEQLQYILHALLGVMTEAGEMAEALVEAIASGNPLDCVNLLEESGDVKWYLAMFARAVGNTWDADERRNIAKLRKRFPEKFTEVNANERDLVGEREILEANSGSQEHSEVLRAAGIPTDNAEYGHGEHSAVMEAIRGG